MGGVRILPKGATEVANFSATGNMTSSTVLTTFAKDFRLKEITVHFSGPSANDVDIYLDALDGSAYDTLLKTIPGGTTTDGVYRPEGEADYEKGDEIFLTWTNDSTLTYGVRIVVEAI